MKMEAFTTNAGDAWIDSEIERELAVITDVDNCINTDEQENILEDNDEIIIEDIDNEDFDAFMKSYESRQNNFLSNIEEQLHDVKNFTHTKVDPNYGSELYEADIKADAEFKGVDAKRFGREILLALDAEDIDDVNISERNDSEVEVENSSLEIVKNSELNEMTGALVEFCESDELERQFREQMKNWSVDQTKKESDRVIENESDYARIKERLATLESHRNELLQNLKLEEISLEQVKSLRNAEIELESITAEDKLKEEEDIYQNTLKELEDSRNTQMKFVEDLITEARMLKDSKRNKAAVKIQSLFRGRRTRLEYAETVQEWIEHGKKKREEQRVKEIGRERREKEVKEMRKVQAEQEEKRRLEMERLKEVERQKREELEKKKEEVRLKKIEEELQEVERRKREEVARRLEQDEQEKHVAVEKRIEEKQKAEEERKNIEKEKLEQTRKLKLEQDIKNRIAEEKRLEEEKRQKLEEERKRAEEKKLKEDEERQKKLQVERQKLENEKKTKEVQQKLEAEKEKKLRIEVEKKAAGERRMKEEEENQELRAEMQRKLQESKHSDAKKKLDNQLELLEGVPSLDTERILKIKSKAQTTTDSQSDDAADVRTMNLEEARELVRQYRLAWMQSCTPLSKILMEMKSRKLITSTIPKRRPSSSKKIPIIADELIFTDGLTDSYDEVTTLNLSDLSARNLSPLTSCVNLTTVVMSKCQIIVLDAFENCKNLQSIQVTESKVEVINLKNLKNLLYVNLSQNQISTIHGLDGCSELKYLNLEKNRITKIENLCHLIKLHTLNLSYNSIIRANSLTDAATIQKLDLSHNNIRKLPEIEKLALVSVMDISYNCLDSLPIVTNNVLLEEFNLENNSISNIEAFSVFWLPLLRTLNLSKNDIAKIPKLKRTISLEKLNLSDNQITETKDFLPGIILCKKLVSVSLSGNPVVELEKDLRSLLKTTMPQLSDLDGRNFGEGKPISCLQNEFDEFCRNQLNATQKLNESYEESFKSASVEYPEIKNSIHRQYFEKSAKMATDFRYAHEYGDSKNDNLLPDFFKFELSKHQKTIVKVEMKRESTPDLHSLSKSNVQDARSKFEMALGGVGPSKACPNPNFRSTKNTTSLPLKQSMNARDKYATKIQSCWRGYICRKRLSAACDFIGNLDLEFGHFDEIDMEAWNLEESALDEDWLPSAKAQILHTSPVLGDIETVSSRPPQPPREAWQASMGLKPPRSPAPSSEITETNRTRASKKSDQITEEWGFKDSRTAELMLKRAKKLKYNAIRKKKLNDLDPKERLAMVRKLEESMQIPIVQQPRKPGTKRTDYFRAKEEENERQRLESVAESQNKLHRTYEWLHAAPDLDGSETLRTTPTMGNITHKPPRGNLRSEWSGSDSNLPKIDNDTGSRVWLTGTGSDQMTIQSVESARRRFSHDGTAHNKYPFPPIKNNSADSAQRKAANIEMGWGGGKKRSTSKRTS